MTLTLTVGLIKLVVSFILILIGFEYIRLSVTLLLQKLYDDNSDIYTFFNKNVELITTISIIIFVIFITITIDLTLL